MNLSTKIFSKIQNIRKKLNSDDSKELSVCLFYPSGQNLERLVNRKEFPPHGPFIVASIFKNIGFKVDIFPIYDDNPIYISKEYDVHAISLISSITYNKVRRFFENNNNPKYLRLVGGFHTQFEPDKILDELSADIVVNGEAEIPLIELFNCNYNNINKIFGLIYRNDLGTIISQGTAVKEENFNNTPFPAFELLKDECFLLKDRVPILNENNEIIAYGQKTLSILCTRGCPYNCYFCASKPEKIRQKSPKNIFNYLNLMKKNYHIDSLVISDESFTINKKWVNKFCKKIKSLNLSWSITTRVDLVDQLLLEKMKDSGCVEIKYGAECGSKIILDNMNKGLKLEDLKNSVKKTASSGILVKLLLIHGLPGESKRTTDETIRLLENLENYIHRVTIFNFRPLRGSYIWNHPQKFDLVMPLTHSSVGIHHNYYHWWGSKSDYDQMLMARKKLQIFVESKFPYNKNYLRN